jgi:hypothetical protein
MRSLSTRRLRHKRWPERVTGIDVSANQAPLLPSYGTLTNLQAHPATTVSLAGRQAFVHKPGLPIQGQRGCPIFGSTEASFGFGVPDQLVHPCQ